MSVNTSKTGELAESDHVRNYVTAGFPVVEEGFRTAECGMRSR